MEKDLTIPIYVDTNALLDLLASIEGGFSTVEKITTHNSESRNIDRGVKAETGTEFGIPNVLSLLKLNLGYSGTWGKSHEGSEQKEIERYHTYGSLFYRLREYLDKNSFLKKINDADTWQKIKPSDFVEIRGVFRPNPFANSLEVIDRLLGMFQIVMGLPSVPESSPSAQGKFTVEERQKLQEQKKRLQEKKERAHSQSKQIEQIRDFLKGVLSDIQSENIRAFVIDLNTPEEYKAVIILFLNYLRDQSMTELSYKEYRLLGKVVRRIEKEKDEPIDLLLGTGLGGIGKETLSQLVGFFDQMPGLNLPELQTEITGPALEIVPIGIFI